MPNDRMHVECITAIPRRLSDRVKRKTPVQQVLLCHPYLLEFILSWVSLTFTHFKPTINSENREFEKALFSILHPDVAI